MMNKEKISVVIPAYNIENEIERCVDSVLAQTYSNIEIVIVNDGSKDNTLEKICFLAQRDSRIIVIDKCNEGVTKARLEGVKASSGEWIGFVDGDDNVEPDMYERLLNNAHKYNADISHCGYQMVFPSRVDYYYNTGRLVQQDKLTGLKNLLDGSFIEPGLCNKLFHKSLFHSLLHDNLIDFSIKNTEDLLMNYYLFNKSAKSIFEDFCPYHYIVRATSAANKILNENRLLDPIKVINILLTETEGNEELNSILREKYIRQLISLAIRRIDENPTLIAPHKGWAEKELRRVLVDALTDKSISRKVKGIASVVALSPTFYRFIHDIYERLKGIDKIYEIK